MPRYLALDYLSEAVQRHKLMMSHLEIAVPQHLENLTLCVYRGIIPDTAYQRVWRRGKGYPEVMKDLHDGILEDLQRMRPYTILPIEIYTKVSNSLICEGSFEVLPSSNAESEMSIDDEILEKLECHLRSCEMKEKFEAVKLAQVRESVVDDWEYMLEDVSSVRHINECLSQMPRLTNMVERLKPNIIPDPLMEGNTGAQNHLQVFIKNDRVLEDDRSVMVDLMNDGYAENFVRMAFTDRDLLEEELEVDMLTGCEYDKCKYLIEMRIGCVDGQCR